MQTWIVSFIRYRVEPKFDRVLALVNGEQRRDQKEAANGSKDQDDAA